MVRVAAAGRPLPDTADQWPTTPPALRQTGSGQQRSVDVAARIADNGVCFDLHHVPY